LVGFCSEDLGAFYLDILKDRLYTTRANSRSRRSAQTALYHITEAMTRLMAPFLSFTANEAWQSLHATAANDDAPTVFELTAHTLPVIPGHEALLGKWAVIRAVRADVLKAIEVEREAGLIGSSLQADVGITVPATTGEILRSLGDGLKFVMITSEADVIIHPGMEPDTAEVNVAPVAHPKCTRCWHLRADVGSDPDHPELCGRCVSNLFGQGESRDIA